jgi:hypothetical protein
MSIAGDDAADKYHLLLNRNLLHHLGAVFFWLSVQQVLE